MFHMKTVPNSNFGEPSKLGTKWRKEKKSKSKIHFWGTKFVKKQQEKNGEMATKLATDGKFCLSKD